MYVLNFPYTFYNSIFSYCINYLSFYFFTFFLFLNLLFKFNFFKYIRFLYFSYYVHESINNTLFHIYIYAHGYIKFLYFFKIKSIYKLDVSCIIYSLYKIIFYP